MLHCGLLGEKLGHSYSPKIHSMLGDYEYLLYERSPEELENFLTNGDWDGLNVTIPYKKAVIPYCSSLSETAKKLGSVNTIVKLPDSSLYGDNTDAYGFECMVRSCGVDITGKKAIVLGSGGASVTVCAVLSQMGAANITVISRNGKDNYKNLSLHFDAEIIVNTTPVGMYPKNGQSPIDLSLFPDCKCVLDIVYNPARTALILQAEKLGIPCKSGLHMLVAQAKRSSDLFIGENRDDSIINPIEKSVGVSLENIAVIGMPGSGKSSVSALLGERLNRKVYEVDELIVDKAGMTIPEIFQKYGEVRFREIETAVLDEIGKLSGIIISTGGGCVTREENYPLLHQNSKIVWILRNIHHLPKDGRPISLKSDLEVLYDQRREQYGYFSDFTVNNDGNIDDTVDNILSFFLNN